MPIRQKLLVCISIACIAGTLPAETTVGTTAGITTDWLYAPPEHAPEIDVELSVSPMIQVFSDLYRFSLSARLVNRVPGVDVDLELTGYQVAFTPATWATVRLGRYSYRPGFAEIFSTTNYFSRTDLTALVRGDLEAAARPGFLAQASGFWNAFYLTGTITPYVYPQLLPPADSPWFPGADIPQTLTLLPFSSEISRDEIRYTEIEPTVPLDWSRPSYSAEIGGSHRGLDFALLWYNGSDNAPLVQARIVDIDPYESFSVELSPVYRRITAAGVDLLYTVGDIRVWIDGSHTFYKLFLTNILDVQQRTTQLAEAPYFEYTAGLSYEPRFANAALVLEYAGSHAFGDSASLVMPALHSVAAGALQWWFFDYRLLSRLTYVLSAEDWSSALLAGLSWDAGPDLSLELTAPLFFGDTTSELGQYRGNWQVSAGIRLRF